MSSSEKVKITRVNYFDGQRITENDLDSDQNYFRSLISNLVLDFHSSGILDKNIEKKILFDSSRPGKYGANLRKSIIELGRYDGKYITLDKQPSDAVYGNRLVFSLSGTNSRGRNSSKVLIVGRVYNSLNSSGNIETEVITLKRDEETITKNFYNKIFCIILNNFSGGIGKNEFQSSLESKNNEDSGKLMVYESEPLTVFTDLTNIEQTKSPNFDLMNFISSSNTKTIINEISESLDEDASIEQVYIDFDIKEELLLKKDADINIKYGQKFISKNNNIQKINVYLGVEKDESLSDPYEWSGEIILSLYELSTEVDCSSTVSPDNLLGFNPELSPIIQLSYDMDDFKTEGVKLGEDPKLFSFDLSNTNVAIPSSELIKKDKYYAFEIRRAGLNNKGSIKIYKGYDIPTRKDELGIPLTPEEKFNKQESRFFQFDPITKKYIEDKESSLWFQIQSSAVQVTDGVCYSKSGLFVMVPKFKESVGNNLIPHIESHHDLPLVDGQKNYLILESIQNFENADVHPRTGNFVYTRIQDIPGFKFVKADHFLNLDKKEYPLILASIADKNPRSSVSITKSFSNAGEYDADYFYILDPDSSILSERLIGRNFIADTKCKCEDIYKIIDVECKEVFYGDLNYDGKIDSDDLNLILDMTNNTLNGLDTERRLFGGEFSIVDFELADVNDDGSIDGFDVELLQDASEGVSDFSTSRTLKFLKIHFESIIEPSSSPIIFLDTVSSGETIASSNTITFTASTAEQALAIRQSDTVVISSSTDAGTYTILTKSVGSDALSVTLTVSLDGGSVSFDGSTGLNVKILSSKETNLFVDNFDLIKLPYKSKEFLIYQNLGVFLKVNYDICDLRRFIEFSYIDIPDNSCICEVIGCDLNACDTKTQNEKFLPGNLLVAGNILDENGKTHKLDYEYTTIKMPLPPGSLNDCKVDLYNTFIKAKNNTCITSAGTEALKYSDGTYVGCEDSGTDTDLTKNRVKISGAIASLHVDGMVDGYSARTDKTTLAVDVTENIGENFNDESYTGFSSFSEYFANPPSSFGSISKPNGENEPATFSFDTAFVAGEKTFILNKPSSSADVAGDFTIDFVAIRSNWTSEDLGTGTVKFAFDGVVKNYISGVLDTTGTFSVGIRKVGSKDREVFFSGKIESSTGSLLYEFEFSENLLDVLGDRITFRIKRKSNVISAYYHISKKIVKEINKFERIGENLTSHLGSGSLDYSYSIGQINKPNANKEFAIKLLNMVIRSNFISFEDDQTLTLGLNQATSRVDRTLFNFPLNLSQRANIIKAEMVLTSRTTATINDTYFVIPLEVLDARIIQTTENYPETTNESLFTDFIPGSLVDGKQFTVDISSIIISYMKNTAHISGFYKALIIEPSSSSDSTFDIDSKIKLNITYEEVTSGVKIKVGMDLDSKTGIASFKTMNVLYDKIIRENRTVISFGVHMKKAGFANEDSEITLKQLQTFGIGTCYTAEQLPADNNCYFITGNVAIGTFVEGPFPCVLKLNE